MEPEIYDMSEALVVQHGKRDLLFATLIINEGKVKF